MEDVPPHRACQDCRGQKVRCRPSDNPDVCQRCTRAGRPCVFAPVVKRRQRKRTDTRVAELEREMRQMRAQLQMKEIEAAAASQAPAVQTLWHKDDNPARLSTAHTGSRDASRTLPAFVRQVRGPAPSLWPTSLPDQPLEPSNDVIDKGLLSMATARQLFETYKTELFPRYPLVYVSPLTTADVMRREKPTLFLAIVAAASAKDNPELSAILDKEVLQSYALRSLVLSQKTLELVQALILSAAWYYPPQRFGQLKYYEYVCMAVSMAMDMGIGSHAPSRHDHSARHRHSADIEASPSALHPAEDPRNPDLSMSIRQLPLRADTASIEARRTFLSCYIISLGVSLSLKRPNIIRASTYLRECLDCLETAPNAPDTDLHLVAWGRLVLIAEEISIAFRYDDPRDTVTIADLQTQMMLKEFQARLTNWDQSVPQTLRGTPLKIMYYTVRLYLFEVALHVDHSPEDFKAPFQMGGLQTTPFAAAVPTKVLAEAIAECVNSAHALLAAFLAVDAESLRAFPVFSFVRVSFAAFVLAKLSLSAASPSSRIAQVLDGSCLQAEFYMNWAILHVKNAVGSTRGRVPSIFLALLFKLRQWCLHPLSLMDSASVTPEENVFDDVIREPRLSHRIESEAARIAEQLSSDESSPATVGSGNSSSNLQPPQPTITPLSPTTGANLGMQSGYSGPFHAQGELGGAPGFSNMRVPYSDAMSGSAQQLAVTNIGDSTSMDDNLFSFLGDAATLPEGGLTGLDAWGDITQDLASMGPTDMMNWQFPSSREWTSRSVATVSDDVFFRLHSDRSCGW